MIYKVQGSPMYVYTGGKDFYSNQPTAVFVHGVLNDLCRAGVLFDEFNDLTIKIESHERGLATLPGD